MQFDPSCDPNADLRARLLDLTDGQLVCALLGAHDRTRDLARPNPALDEALTAEAVVISTVLDRFAPDALVLAHALREGTVGWADDVFPRNWVGDEVT
jgi:hypothetical protein